VKFQVRLDLERIERSLQAALGTAQEVEDLYRFLAALGLKRKNDEWWWATDEALCNLLEGEVLEKRPAP
jgi:hypothetical protein